MKTKIKLAAYAFGILLVTFVTLKLLGAIAWSWAMALIPAMLPLLVVLVIIYISVVIEVAETADEWRRRTGRV